MAKKKESISKVNTTKKTVNNDSECVVDDKKYMGELHCETEALITDSKIVPAYKKYIEHVGIEELVAYEKACSVVCGKYEVKARLSGEDNAKFMQFLEYHKLIVDELEKRVVNACKLLN